MPAHPHIPTPPAPAYFDYRRAAAEAGVSEAELRAIVRVFEGDYPNDLLLRELHVLRACHAIARGTASVQKIVAGGDTQAA